MPPRAVAKPLDHDFLGRRKLNLLILFTNIIPAYSHLLLDVDPEKPGARKLPEKSGFFARIDIPGGTLIYADDSTFTATIFINNPNLQEVLERASRFMPQEREDHFKKVWLSQRGSKRQMPKPGVYVLGLCHAPLLPPIGTMERPRFRKDWILPLDGIFTPCLPA